MIWHFAHKSLENCVEYYDNKGVWHRQMQELFPEKNREVFNNEFGKHFYDVLTDRGTIIEFQKAPISISIRVRDSAKTQVHLELGEEEQ